MFIRKLPPLPVLRELFTADAEAGKLYWKICPSPRKAAGEEAGRPSIQGRRYVTIDNNMYAVSRILWMLYTGRDPGANYIDHINGDPSDNRLCNLRSVTPGENGINKKPYGATGHRGVYYARRLRSGEPRYVVTICRVIDRDVNGKYIRKTYNYGYFADLQDAIEAAEKAHAEWGMLEFLPSDRKPAAKAKKVKSEAKRIDSVEEVAL